MLPDHLTVAMDAEDAMCCGMAATEPAPSKVGYGLALAVALAGGYLLYRRAKTGPYKVGAPVYLNNHWFVADKDGNPTRSLDIQLPVPLDVFGQNASAMVDPPFPLFGQLANDAGVYGAPYDNEPATAQEHTGAPVQIFEYKTGGYQGKNRTWANVLFLLTGNRGWVGLSDVNNTSTKNPVAGGA